MSRSSFGDCLRPVSVKVNCSAKSTEEKDAEVGTKRSDDNVGDVNKDGMHQGSASSRITPSSADSLSLGIREPVYEVFFLAIIVFCFAISSFNSEFKYL